MVKVIYVLMLKFYLCIFTDIISVALYILVVEKESGETELLSVNSLISFLCCTELYLMFSFHSVFQRLANDQFCTKNRCIVISVSSGLFIFIIFPSYDTKVTRSCNFIQGRGYPDVNTRRYSSVCQNFSKYYHLRGSDIF